MKELNSHIEIFQDVSFVYPLKESNRLRDSLSEATTPPWRLDIEREKDLRSRSENDTEVISFSRDSLNGIPASYTSLWCPDSRNWRVPNVVPVDYGTRFTIHQYNELLDDFLTMVLKPVLRSLNVKCDVSPRRLCLKEMLSEASQSAFQAYLSLGQPYSCALHPKDEQRLCEFIWCLHEQEEHFDPDLFRRWLKEAMHWPNDYADGLATRIDQGLVLLKTRESH